MMRLYYLNLIFYIFFLDYYIICDGINTSIDAESNLKSTINSINNFDIVINETSKLISILTTLAFKPTVDSLSIKNTISDETQTTTLPRSPISPLQSIECIADSDCINELVCVENYCLNGLPSTANNNVNSDTAIYIKPYLWIIIIGLPLVMIIAIIVAFIFYFNKTCCKKILQYRRYLQPQIEISTTISRSTDTSLNESNNQTDRRTHPPFYNEIICINTEEHDNRNNFLNKDLFNTSMERLPTYSSWSKKNNRNM